VHALTRVLSHAQRHTFDAGSQEFVVTALRAHAPGEQLRIAYGRRMCNDRLLRLYGKETHVRKCIARAENAC
jgi:hypothetical protein